jgi:hypothetical protein
LELISRALDNPVKTDMIDKRKIIESLLEENQSYPAKTVKTVLTQLGVVLEDSSIDFLYI